MGLEVLIEVAQDDAREASSEESLDDASSHPMSEASDLAERALDRDLAQHAERMALERYLDLLGTRWHMLRLHPFILVK